MKALVVLICVIVLLAAWIAKNGNLTTERKELTKTELLLMGLWFGGLVLVGMFTVQMPEPYSAIFGTFGLIGLVVGMFKFAECTISKNKSGREGEDFSGPLLANAKPID